MVGLKARRLDHHSIWTHPHFSSATLAQFFYVAAQSGIFAYFINYMTSQAPVEISNKTASTLASVGFVCFLVGRFTGAGLLKKFPAHKVLGLYALLNVVACALVMLKLGWLSVACVFLSYFFMSIMFPTIFALGIHGLGARAKKASSFIVMAIMGGAIVPKVMGHVADQTDISRGFIVPLVCFLVVAAYGLSWTRLPGLQAPSRCPPAIIDTCTISKHRRCRNGRSSDSVTCVPVAVRDDRGLATSGPGAPNVRDEQKPALGQEGQACFQSLDFPLMGSRAEVGTR